MFQSSSTASGIALRHCSSACCPSSASVILKSRPSRMRRATLRMTLESSTTKQVFMGSPPCCTQRAGPLPSFLLCGQRFRRAVEHEVHVKNQHQLPIEAMYAAGYTREPRVEI